jgi:hypothetical protein
MAQVIQHKRGGLDNLKNIDPVYRGEFVLATGSLSIHNADGANGTQDVEIAFIGGVSDYEPVTKFLSGGGLPSITTGTHGTYLDGILWYDSSSGQQYQLNATVTATEAGAADYTGSHVAITSPVSNGQGAIGAAEDGTYTDGLFTDFTSTTTIGTAVDRFNEILKALSPAPAPDLDDIDSNDTGVSAELSFGSSFDELGYVLASGIGSLSAVDQDGTFTVTSAGNDLRRGVFNGSTTIDGDLNEDVAADGINYPANAFGDANLGTLQLEVNGSNVHSVDLTTFTSGDDLNANGSGFNLTITSSAQFDDATELDVFQHRTGTWKVHPNDQNEYGWNYARVKHIVGATTKTTNYVTWVNDLSASNAANDVNFIDEELANLSLSGTNYISGVKYFTAGTAEYTASFENAYINVYSSAADAISYNETNINSVSSETLPALSGEDPATKTVTLNKDITLPSNTRILNSNIAISTTVKKPLRSNITSTSLTSGSFLYNNESNTSTLTSETFRKENYRIKAGTYATQGSVPTTSEDTGYWEDDSFNLGNVDLNDENGLLVYDRKLISPTNGTFSLNGGDFNGAVTNGPADNADYSGIASDTSLTFYRIFRNTTGEAVFQFNLTLAGVGTLVSSPASGNQFKLEFRLPTNSGTGFGTAYLDGTDGTYVVGALDTSVGLTNTYTTLTQGISNNDYIIVRVTARADWTGYFTAMSVAF